MKTLLHRISIDQNICFGKPCIRGTRIYLRLIEIKMLKANMKMSAATVMSDMHRLHSCLVWKSKQKVPMRLIEEPTKLQEQILKAFGHAVKTGGVLQKIAR
jgi:hypothetical protein